MDYHYFKDKLNRLYERYIGLETRPTFFDIEDTCSYLNKVTAHFPIIKQEFEHALANTPQLPCYHEIDPGEAEISNSCEKKWNVFMLHLLGYNFQEGLRLCPSTLQIINNVPGVIQAFFSILEPGKSIPLHDGPYKGYLRYHLGIEIPKINPPTIIVNQQPHTWKEGEAILFDDSWPHEVQNHSTSPRAVLIVDILRPMPLFPRLVNQLVTRVIARYAYGRSVLKRAEQYGEQIKPLLQ